MHDPPAESPKAALVRLGLSPKKSFGQNFLADQNLAARIAEHATKGGGQHGCGVIELGTGLGALTRPLLRSAGRVITVERDRDLIPALRAEFAEAVEAGKLEILEADAKEIDVPALLARLPRPHVLCGNLPYQLTGPLIELAVGAASQLDRVVFLVQLEVADRLCAAPGSKVYGALTVFVAAQFAARRAFVIKRGAFYPQPGVDSAVVVFESLRPPRATETPAFRALVHAAFAKRRKTLRNAWSGVHGLSNDALVAAAERSNIALTARGETLAVEDFARMAQEITK
jgi:16S rRNA (adenine1518-N6/adenine1519-N6)-dimethyltransferase